MEFLKNKIPIVNRIFFIFITVLSIPSCGLHSDSILIKISDGSKCTLKQYSIEMSEMTVSFSLAQVNAIKAERTEIFLDIPVSNKELGIFKYKVRAVYENCTEIVSDERKVERGYIIYESIYENKIDYQIRAK